jgi:two-component system OmpR family sensor kinase
LVDNAVKYTPSGGRVNVAVNPSPHGVSVSVSDSGPGIEPGLRERVFNRFYRVVGNEEEGSGLGLSIVQRIAELHQAVVGFDAEYGRGLRVVVQFPQPIQ